MTTKEQYQAALDAFRFLVSNAKPRVEINIKHVYFIETALLAQIEAPADDVRESVQIVRDMMLGGGIHTSECEAIETLVRSATTPVIIAEIEQFAKAEYEHWDLEVGNFAYGYAAAMKAILDKISKGAK